jgi:hypothetical protein
MCSFQLEKLICAEEIKDRINLSLIKVNKDDLMSESEKNLKKKE